jgi:uncharacterized protein (TIGR03437 family)
VVPIRGEIADIALDEVRGRLYIANLPAFRIDVMNTGDRSFAPPMTVPMPPSTLSLSPDARYLVVGEYELPFGSTGGLTIFDLSAGLRTDIATPNPVLAVAFGAGSQALVVTNTALFLLNPQAGSMQMPPVSAGPFYSSCLPVPFATYPPNITQASAGVSGDGQTIMVMLSVGSPTAPSGPGTPPTTPAACQTAATPSVQILSYSVATSAVTVTGFLTSPIDGPRVVSVDQTGQNFLAGWGLSNPENILLAQFPYPSGVLNIGSHAWDWAHNRIFAQIPAAGDGAVLHVVDTDNLTVRERIQLPENLAGRSIWSSNRQTLYSISISGVTVFPMGTFDKSHRVGSLQEDVLFQGSACDRSMITQTINVVDLGGGNVDFSLSLPPNTPGITMTPSSGTTPATVQISVDPTVFQSSKGTTAIPLTISSAGSINLGATVRLLIATPDVNQHGRIIDVPGQITDMLADPIRKRVYLIRQDKNLVLVYDTTSFKQIGSFRTGNTPVGMMITLDRKNLIVGNDNSQIDNVYDLDTMQPKAPVLLALGLYGHSIAAASDGQVFQIVRSANATLTPPCNASCVIGVNLAAGSGNPLASLGIFTNSLTSANGILTASADGSEILMALPDGTVALYDATASEWVASRKDLSALGGAAGAFSDNVFLVDNHVLDAGLVAIANLETGSGSSSGVAVSAGAGLRTTSSGANTPGVVERIDLNSLQTFHNTLTDEAPVVPSILQTAPVGQIGQTVLPFVRSLAIPADQSSIVILSVSGITVLENSFDAATALPAISGVVNAADGTAAVAPGGLIVISGISLAATGAAATQLPLPTTLGNVCVTANNTALPLFSVSASQIMAQLPFTVSGSTSVVVRNPGGIGGAFTANVQSFAPAIFHNGQAGDQTGIATVVRSVNNELVTFTNPIHPDEMITIYLTGMARTSPLPALGDGAPLDPLAMVTTRPTVTLGSTNLDVLYAGLVPGEVGVYQIDAYIPKNIQSSPSTPLTINQGQASTTYLVRTVNP